MRGVCAALLVVVALVTLALAPGQHTASTPRPAVRPSARIEPPPARVRTNPVLQEPTPSPIAEAATERLPGFEEMCSVLAKRPYDPRDAVPHIITLIKEGRYRSDDVVARRLSAAWFQVTIPIEARYLIPALLVALPGGEEALHGLVLREREGDVLAVEGLITGLQHLDEGAGKDWESETFWTGYLLCHAQDLGFDFYNDWLRERARAAAALAGRPFDVNDVESWAGGSGHPVVYPGYNVGHHPIASRTILSWLTEGFRGEERYAVVQDLLYRTKNDDPSNGSFDLAAAFYRDSKTASVGLCALRAMSYIDNATSEAAFREVLADPPNQEWAYVALQNRYVSDSQDPTLVPLILGCYRTYGPQDRMDIYIIALAEKDSGEAYNLLDRIFDGKETRSDYQETLVSFLPRDPALGIRDRVRSLLLRGLGSENGRVREVALRVCLDKDYNEALSLLDSIAVGSSLPEVREWAKKKLLPASR